MTLHPRLRLLTRFLVRTTSRSLRIAYGAIAAFALLAATPPSISPSEIWLPPLGPPFKIDRAYDLPNGPYQAGHRGIDLPASLDDTVVSPVSGVVSFRGTVVDRPVLSIRVDEDTVVSFEPVESSLTAGDQVLRGDQIGMVASGDHCANGCLHLGVRVDGNYVNPIRYFHARPVLLPW